MPNCDFYALDDDVLEVTEFVFKETPCQIFESYSEPCESLIQFSKPLEIVDAYYSSTGNFLLQLYSPTMKGKFFIDRFDLDPKKFGNGAFRNRTMGWGQIQLYFGRLQNEKLQTSHTNHNSQKRAMAWYEQYPENDDPSLWDWDEVLRISRKINRFIRKISVDKIGSRVVLKAANTWVSKGGDLSVS